MVAELGPMVGKRTRPRIANDITELIGNTPLLKLGRNAEGLDATILLKMEAMEVKRGRSALGGAWGGSEREQGQSTANLGDPPPTSHPQSLIQCKAAPHSASQ